MAITKIQSESMNLADTYAFTGTVTGAGGVNTPAFNVTMTGVSSAITEGALVTLTVFNSEILDTDNAFDTSTGKFTPQTAGKYYVEVQTHVDRGGSTMSDLYMAYLQLFKNNSSTQRCIMQHDMRNNGGRGFGLYTSGIFDMNGSTDFIYSAVSSNTASNNDLVVTGESNYTWMRGYKLIT